jgi:BirA family biotin operon repressor/biotin-[acetyl-CoA-carboxylase] ligase
MSPSAEREGLGWATAAPDELRHAMDRAAQHPGCIGHTLHYYDTVGSTNDVARELACGGARPGLVVIAERQTAGRGQRGRSWFSPADSGLYVSVLLGLPVHPRHEPGVGLLTLGSGVALADALRSVAGVEVRLKWPNDLVIEAPPARRRKIGGILAEGVVREGTVADVVLGFGINVRREAYPADLAGVATSLEEATGAPIRRGDVLAEALRALDRVVADLFGGRVAEILDRWRRLSPSASGATVRWTLAGGARRVGTTEGIDGDGALRVRTTTGLERVVSADLTWD